MLSEKVLTWPRTTEGKSEMKRAIGLPHGAPWSLFHKGKSLILTKAALICTGSSSLLLEPHWPVLPQLLFSFQAEKSEAWVPHC